MTRVSVTVGALSAAAPRLFAVARDAGEDSATVVSVLSDLDMKIRAREHFDARLLALSAELREHSERLARHAEFLLLAAGRYDAAENSVVDIVPRDPTAGSGEVRAGYFGDYRGSAGGGGGGGGWGGEGSARIVFPRWLWALPALPMGPVLAPAQSFSFLVGQAERVSGLPVAGGIGFATDLLEASGRVPGIGWVGKVLTLSTVLDSVSDGQFAQAAWDVAGFVPHVGAFQFGWDIGTYIADDLGVSNWVVGQVEGAGGWSGGHESVGTVDVFTDTFKTIKEGLPAGLESLKDRVVQTFVDGLPGSPKSPLSRITGILN